MLSEFSQQGLIGTRRRFGLPPKTVTAGVAVLKFGSSVLASEADLPRVAGEVARQSVRYRQLVVVVSAFEGDTDRLLSEGSAIAADTQCRGVADLVSIGEELAAAKLAIACSRIGLDPFIARAEQNGIVAEGPELSARPTGLAWPHEGRSLVIVPGFVALNPQGRRVLLGRGGSDFSAIYLGGELGADLVRLYKDVDGVYDHDPRDGHKGSHRYTSISWSQCLDVARPLLQPAAIEYARRKRLPLEVGSIGGRAPTRVTDLCRLDPAPRGGLVLKVGLAGFGVVGQALYERIRSESHFEIVAVLVRDLTKSRRFIPSCGLTVDRDKFLHEDFDILVDATCGEEIGQALANAQLRRGGAVVSANKVAIEPNWKKLVSLAQQKQAQLRYSACVGGGTPVLETIDQARRCGSIRSVRAVLNGTVNFLLDRLSHGDEFHAALKVARKAGFAEDDPAQDLSGEDARIKLALAARHAFGPEVSVDTLQCVPLDFARQTEISESGERWVQLAMLNRGNGVVQGQVGYVPASIIDNFPDLPAEWNFARVELDDGRVIEVKGRGAGGAATAEAIVMDLYEIASARRLRLAIRAA